MFNDISQTIIYISLFFSLYFEVFLLITYFEKRPLLRQESIQQDLARFPTVTVIVPCFNEETTIPKTIFSLLRLDYPKDKLDIIIVDDGSVDGTLRALHRFKNNSRVRVYSKPNGGKHTALNYGLQYVESELVGCLDADSFVEPGTLKTILKYFNDSETMAVTPAVRVYKPRTVIELIQKVEYTWGIFYRKMLHFLGAIFVTPGPFTIYRTEVFRKIGDYRHAHLTEDLELALRMQTNHLKIVNAHNAYVHTVVPKTLRSLYKQRLRWTYGFLNNSLDYKFLIFNKRYGNIGFYVLPMAIISIFSSILLLLILTSTNIARAYDGLIKFITVGPDLGFSFDWFFVHTSPSLFLTVFSVGLIVSILVLARRMTEGRFHFSLDLFYFLFLYGLIVPFWISHALFNTVFSRKTTWR